jgi:hypothetical protein
MQIQKQGFAFDDGEHAIGLRCVASCIYDECGEAFAAISVSGPKSRIPDERITHLGSLVMRAASEITHHYGGKAIPADYASQIKKALHLQSLYFVRKLKLLLISQTWWQGKHGRLFHATQFGHFLHHSCESVRSPPEPALLEHWHRSHANPVLAVKPLRLEQRGIVHHIGIHPTQRSNFAQAIGVGAIGRANYHDDVALV